MTRTDLQITIQHFDGCPHWRKAVERVHEAVDRAGVEAEVRLQLKLKPHFWQRLIDTPEAAAEHDFRGSPTVLVNGVDPFADSGALVGLSCRVYMTPEGMAGSPTIEQLVDVMRGKLADPTGDTLIR